MMKVVFLWSLIVTLQYGGVPCSTSMQTQVDILKLDTKSMISRKENTIKKEVNKYANALKKKKEAMVKLLKTIKKIEALMKINQQERRKIIKHWDDVSKSHTILN